MTINAAATQLLTHFAWEERSIPDFSAFPGRNAAVMLAMNGALQEIYGKASPWARYQDRGALLKAPVRVTISVVDGSKLAQIIGRQSWMEGCTVVIDGAMTDNLITNGTEPTELKYPHQGPGGYLQGTVYHDSVLLDSDVMETVRPIRANGVPLRVDFHPDPPIATAGDSEDYAMHRSSCGPVAVPRIADSLGQPLRYKVEPWNSGALPRMRIRLFPVPEADGYLDYRALLGPPMVVTDLYSNALLPVPAQYVQSIFYPIARQRLSACSFFRADGTALQEMARSYQDAIELLAGLKPHKDTGAVLATLY